MRNLITVVTLCSALLSESALAAEAGKALFVFGDVSVETGNGTTALAKNARLSVGDTVYTGSNGLAQLLLNDNTKIALRSDTHFQIEAFSYPTQGAAAPVAIADIEARFELLKGGFRSITGAASKTHPAGFSVKTPVAVIGVRGTDFLGRLCDAADSCGDNVATGLYLGVNEGTIYTEVNGQEYDVYDDRFGFVNQLGFTQLPDLPAGILDSGLGSQPADAGQATNRFISITADPAVPSTPVQHRTPEARESTAVEPAGHEQSQ